MFEEQDCRCHDADATPPKLADDLMEISPLVFRVGVAL
jgi:hypothetical protein